MQCVQLPLFSMGFMLRLGIDRHVSCFDADRVRLSPSPPRFASSAFPHVPSSTSPRVDPRHRKARCYPLVPAIERRIWAKSSLSPTCYPICRCLTSTRQPGPSRRTRRGNGTSRTKTHRRGSRSSSSGQAGQYRMSIGTVGVGRPRLPSDNGL